MKKKGIVALTCKEDFFERIKNGLQNSVRKLIWLVNLIVLDADLYLDQVRDDFAIITLCSHHRHVSRCTHFFTFLKDEIKYNAFHCRQKTRKKFTTKEFTKTLPKFQFSKSPSIVYFSKKTAWIWALKEHVTLAAAVIIAKSSCTWSKY